MSSSELLRPELALLSLLGHSRRVSDCGTSREEGSAPSPLPRVVTHVFTGETVAQTSRCAKIKKKNARQISASVKSDGALRSWGQGACAPPLEDAPTVYTLQPCVMCVFIHPPIHTFEKQTNKQTFVYITLFS